jgi:predicted HD superfamily hydrolase involved in NAD metabolism
MFSKTSYTGLEGEVRALMSEKRFLHSLGTAQTCVSLNAQYGENLDEDECYRCGLLHDLVREWPDAKLKGYASEHQLPLEPEEQNIPMLLHGPVAADILRQKGYDASLCTAVRYHTLGNKSMGRLGLILFIADFIEPGRTHITEEQRVSLLGEEGLEDVCCSLLSMQDSYFASKGKRTALSSQVLWRFLEEGGRL